MLHDIIRRFEYTHKILLCGDLNGTLLATRNNEHDVQSTLFITTLFVPSYL